MKCAMNNKRNKRKTKKNHTLRLNKILQKKYEK